METKMYLTNRQNPLETLGIRHNYALDAVGNTKNFEELSFKEIHDIVMNSNGIHYQPRSYFATIQDFYSKDLPILLEADDKIPSLVFSWDRINLPTKQLLDILFGLIKVNIEKEPEIFCHELINFENTILKNYPLGTSIGESKSFLFGYKKEDPFISIVIGTSVIARYSQYYWYTAYNDPNNPWYNFLHDGEVKALPRWLRAAWKDFSSFFSAPDCTETTYYPDGSVSYVTDLGCCWEYAGDCSAAVK